MDAQAWVAQAIEAVAPVIEGASPKETPVLVERARRLLDSGELAIEDQNELEELVSSIQTAQATGDISYLEELLDVLLDLLFDLEED
jgi:hypothetical protein